jgi:hypothetical protein
MSPVTKGPVPGLTSGLRRVSVDPSHFRSGRWLLLAEGLAVGALGIAGIVSSSAQTSAARALGLGLALWQAGSLLGFGLLAVMASLRRRVAVIVTASAAVAFLVLLVISSVAVVHGGPRTAGFRPFDIVLYGVLAGLNLALLMWLVPDALEGPAWVPARRHRPTERTRRGTKP